MGVIKEFRRDADPILVYFRRKEKIRKLLICLAQVGSLTLLGSLALLAFYFWMGYGK